MMSRFKLKPLARDVLSGLGWFVVFLLVMGGAAGFVMRFFDILPYLLRPEY